MIFHHRPMGVLLILLPLLLSACGNGDDGLLHGRAISVVVSDEDYPPFTFVDPDTGEGAGWGYDAVREICRRVDCVPEFVPVPYTGIFEALNAGAYDTIATGVTITDERKELVEFSIPFVATTEVLIVRADDPSSLEEFKADPTKLVGVVAGTTNEATAHLHFPAERILTYGDEDPRLEDLLLKGVVDGIVYDNIVALQLELDDELRTAGTLTPEKDLAFAFPPDGDLVGAFNAALLGMMHDGTLEELNRRWDLIE